MWVSTEDQSPTRDGMATAADDDAGSFPGPCSAIIGLLDGGAYIHLGLRPWLLVLRGC